MRGETIGTLVGDGGNQREKLTALAINAEPENGIDHITINLGS